MQNLAGLIVSLFDTSVANKFGFRAIVLSYEKIMIIINE